MNQIQVVRTRCTVHIPADVQSIWLIFLNQLQSTIADEVQGWKFGLLALVIYQQLYSSSSSIMTGRAGIFLYAGPLSSADLQNMPDTLTFKKRLKTFLFNSAF